MRSESGRLLGHPFFVAEARLVGMTWLDLQGKAWRRLSYGQYASRALRPDPRLLLRAAVQRVPPDYAFSGRTAAWLHGLDMPPCDPIEITVRREASVRARAGLRLCRAALDDSDVTRAGEFRTTSPMRTVRDLGSRADLVEAVVSIEMAAQVELVMLTDLDRYIATHAGTKGIRRLRRAAGLVDVRSESPMETRLRIELVKARLPRPAVQADLHDAKGRFLARADLYYPDRRLLLEYDGENHKDRLIADLRRQNALVNAGYHLLRFTATDLRAPRAVVAQVREARARIQRISVRPDFAA